MPMYIYSKKLSVPCGSGACFVWKRRGTSACRFNDLYLGESLPRTGNGIIKH